MTRLKDRLNDAGYGGFWLPEHGYIVRLGKARQIFLSADEEANVVGATAHILLEVDESQDVSREKFSKEFWSQFANSLALHLAGVTLNKKPKRRVGKGGDD
jgi:hypothetical protein